MPEMLDALSTRITETTETSQLCITSTVESRSDHIIGEIHGLQEIQREVREHMTQIWAKLHDKKGYYKGVRCFSMIHTCGYMTCWQVQDLDFGDIELRQQFPCLAHHSKSFGFDGALPVWSSDCTCSYVCGYQDGYCNVDNSNKTKIIRMYRPSINNGKDAMKVSAWTYSTVLVMFVYMPWVLATV